VAADLPTVAHRATHGDSPASRRQPSGGPSGDQPVSQSVVTMEKIVNLCKRRGFVFQSSEIYGGLSSCYDYGPLGLELKRNVKEAW